MDYRVCQHCGAPQSDEQPQSGLHCYDVEYTCGNSVTFCFGSESGVDNKLCGIGRQPLKEVFEEINQAKKAEYGYDDFFKEGEEIDKVQNPPEIRTFKPYDDVEVTLEVTDKKKAQAFDKILEYCKENSCFSGETLMQDDNCLIYAPEVLADIIDDILKFETKDI